MTVAGMVSTIIPVHNRPLGLREAVESVLAQDHRPIEILIVDDGSTDKTCSVAHELAAAHESVIRVLAQENGGPGVARETGRRAACGEFLQYLDSDDVLLPGKFSRQVEALRVDHDAVISYGWVRYRHADGSVHPQPWKRTGDKLDALFPAILVERWWETACPLYRASTCDRAGPWLPLYHEEDWEYDCRVGALGARLTRVDDYVCEHRDHSGPRLSYAESSPRHLRHRAIAQAAMYEHAERAGLAHDSAEFTQFARRTFLLSRQCGAAGLVAESTRLFELARKASAGVRADGWDFRLYEAAARVLGWRIVGRLACLTDRVRAGA